MGMRRTYSNPDPQGAVFRGSNLPIKGGIILDLLYSHFIGENFYTAVFLEAKMTRMKG
jgi:hypothetical protein